MKPASDGKPLCGSFSNELGVRPDVDIVVDTAGQVHPQTGGLSATPDDPTLLPPHVRPQGLGGKGKLPLFVIEVAQLELAGAAPDLGPPLASRRDPRHPLKHAFIEPARVMSLADLQACLGATRGAWEAAAL